MLAAEHVTVRVGGRLLLDDVSVTVNRGEIVAVVGPNGAGKSTLVAVLAGDRKPAQGTVTIDGRALTSMRLRERARHRAVLPQSTHIEFPFLARDVVAMGCTGAVSVAAAMAETETSHLADRAFPTLSGGEQARVTLARVLAQDTPVVLLDEPAAALDLRHQERILTTCRRLADRGRAVLVVLHDLQHASIADRIVVLNDGRIAAEGSPRDVLTAKLVEVVFDISAVVVDHPADGRPVVLTLTSTRSAPCP